MIDAEAAGELARSWVAAWNAHDLEAILAHYADDVEFGSPFVAARGFSPDGVIRGLEQLRAYFASGLLARPDLAFELDDIFAGVDGVALSYHWRTGDVRVVETMQLAGGKVVRARAHYVAEQIVWTRA